MFFILAIDRSDKDSVVHCTPQVGHSGDPFGDIYCRSYTYCRQRQFMLVFTANIAALQHILSPGWDFYHVYIVVGDNMCQIVPLIFLTHIVKHFKKIIG